MSELLNYLNARRDYYDSRAKWFDAEMAGPPKGANVEGWNDFVLHPLVRKCDNFRLATNEWREKVNIKIYSKTTCPYCSKAKQLFDSMELPYEEKVIVERDDEVHVELKNKAPNAKSVPQVFINEKLIGGYEELVAYIEETGFTGSGDSLS